MLLIIASSLSLVVSTCNKLNLTSKAKISLKRVEKKLEILFCLGAIVLSTKSLKLPIVSVPVDRPEATVIPISLGGI